MDIICMYMYMYVCMYVCMYVYIYISIRRYVYKSSNIPNESQCWSTNEIHRDWALMWLKSILPFYDQTMGKPWENDGLMGFNGIYPLVI